jgi:hypothetical protein
MLLHMKTLEMIEVKAQFMNIWLRMVKEENAAAYEGPLVDTEDTTYVCIFLLLSAHVWRWNVLENKLCAKRILKITFSFRCDTNDFGIGHHHHHQSSVIILRAINTEAHGQGL